MRRLSSRLQRLTFEALLCGEAKTALPPPQRLAVACARAEDIFADQSSTNAPLPIKLATAAVASLIMENKLKEATALLLTHPSQKLVWERVRDYVAYYPDSVSSDALRGMCEEARHISPAAVTAFLQALVQQFRAKFQAAPSSEREREVWDSQREGIRHLVVRHCRLHPQSTSSLLRFLCEVSHTTSSDRDDVVELMNVAMRHRTLNPEDFGYVLEVLWRCADARGVVAMWKWMEHTSAVWDVRACSVAMMAFSRLNKMDEAVGCMQRLAEADSDPSVEAQRSFLRFLGRRTPPLLQYAVQLVEHWYPRRERLWCGEAQAVGVELALLYCACGQNDSAVRLLEDATEVQKDHPVELNALLLQPMVTSIGEKCTALIVQDARLCKALVDALLGSSALSDSPRQVGLLLSLGMATARLPEVHEALKAAALTQAQLHRALQSFVNTEVARVKSPTDLLTCVREVSAYVGQEPPKELASWLELLAET